VIVDVSHVALRVPDVDASVEFAVDTLGMHEVERIDGRAYLTHASPYPSLGDACGHHAIEYISGPEAAFDHVGMLVRDRQDLDEVGANAQAAGGTILEHDFDEPGLAGAIRFAAPSGQVFEVHTAMEQVNRSYTPRGLRTRRLGHVTFAARDLAGLTQFLVDALGFEVSDQVSNDDGLLGTFARCHYEHHTLGAVLSPIDGLHHIALEALSSTEIGLLGDHLVRTGRQFIWGPARHGVGDNIAAYVTGPDGIVVEIYSDMMRIMGEWEPRSWTAGPDVANMWSPPADLEPLMTAEIPLAVAAHTPGSR
jgi:catechol 2,3-dioxygenase-like lactoylglutathione lyase family enzyme